MQFGNLWEMLRLVDEVRLCGKLKWNREDMLTHCRNRKENNPEGYDAGGR